MAYKIMDLFPNAENKLQQLEDDGYEIVAIQNNIIIAKGGSETTTPNP